MTGSGLIDQLKSRNRTYASSFQGEGVPGSAGQGLLILTCMDSRIVPHEIFGLEIGDVKVIRNAGGQLNPEVELDIVLASHLLNCHTIVVMPHTKCAMASMSLIAVQERLKELTNLDFSTFNPRMIDDAESKLRADVSDLRKNPMTKNGVQVFGAIYDVDTGLVKWLD
ncbi:MAG: carbonic anhydrase [Candidatus Thermoplasmatota archaeon]|nr:carbonic anhydrase [Candidatus Thermoplasmatota archaeon]